MRRATIICPFAAVVLALWSAGCDVMRLEHSPHLRQNDWPVSGKTIAHVASASTTVVPPLTLDWEQDINAGVGRSSPVVIDSVVFLGTKRGELFAIHVRSGKRLGLVSLGDAIEGAPALDGGFAVVGITNSHESLIAYDLVNGRISWKRAQGDVEMTPVIQNQRVYFGTTNGRVFCVERATGDPVWKFEILSNERLKGIRSSPALADSTLVFGAEDGVVYALNIGSGQVRWKYRTNAPVEAAPSIENGTVYVGNTSGRFYAIDLRGGATRWMVDTGSPIYGSALPYRGTTIVGNIGGSLFAFRQDSGAVAWKCECGGPVSSGAIAVGEYIYVGTLQRELLAIRNADGSIAWRKDVGGRIKTTPAAAYGRIFVATDERVLLCYRGSTQ